MAAEISIRDETTGTTMRATIRKDLTVGGKVQMWSTSGTPAWEDMTVANWANYIITLTETPASSYVYVGTWPATLTTVGWYHVDIYRGTAISSVLCATLYGYWDGTVFNLNGANVEQASSAHYQAIANTTEGRKVWHVAKTGNDANDGKTLGTAKLTIAGAVAVCGQGDEIVVWASATAYTEAVDLSALTGVKLNVMPGATITEGQAGYGLYVVTLGPYNELTGGGTINYGPNAWGAFPAVYSTSADGIHVHGMNIVSGASGVWLGGDYCRVESNRITAPELGINSGDYAVVRNNVLACLGWNECDAMGIGVAGVSGIVEGNTINFSIPADTPGSTARGINIATGCSAQLTNNRVHAEAAIGCSAFALDVVGTGNVLSDGNEFSTGGAGTLADIRAASGASVSLTGTKYATTSGTGTITNLDQASADAALVANNLDHVAGTATGIPTLPAGTWLDIARSDGTATYDRTTDSQQAIRDRGDSAWITATGFATPTNITAGTITTVTNLTNAPTVGDFTTTMKTSVATAVDASTLAGKFAGITLIAKWLRGLFRKDTMDATAKGEVNLTGGTFNEATDSLEAQQEYAAASRVATNYTGAFSVGVLANAPTGATASYTVSTATVGAAPIFDIIACRYAAFGPHNVTAQTAQTGDSHAFLVYDSADPDVVLWSLTTAGSEISVDGTGLILTLTDTDAHMGTSGTYAYVLRNTTDDTRVCEGSLTIDNRPNVPVVP